MDHSLRNGLTFRPLRPHRGPKSGSRIQSFLFSQTPHWLYSFGHRAEAQWRHYHCSSTTDDCDPLYCPIYTEYNVHTSAILNDTLFTTVLLKDTDFGFSFAELEMKSRTPSAHFLRKCQYFRRILPPHPSFTTFMFINADCKHPYGLPNLGLVACPVFKLTNYSSFCKTSLL